MTREEAIDCINAIHVQMFNSGNSKWTEACDMAIEALKDRPHGEWLSHYDYCKKHECIPSGLIAFWWCNRCEQGVEIQTNFCPNCGADMRTQNDRSWDTSERGVSGSVSDSITQKEGESN